MIVTEHGIWIEEGDEIKLTNLQMCCPKGVNPLAFLEFIGAEVRGSEKNPSEET